MQFSSDLTFDVPLEVVFYGAGQPFEMFSFDDLSQYLRTD